MVDGESGGVCEGHSLFFLQFHVKLIFLLDLTVRAGTWDGFSFPFFHDFDEFEGRDKVGVDLIDDLLPSFGGFFHLILPSHVSFSFFIRLIIIFSPQLHIVVFFFFLLFGMLHVRPLLLLLAETKGRLFLFHCFYSPQQIFLHLQFFYVFLLLFIFPALPEVIVRN